MCGKANQQRIKQLAVGHHNDESCVESACVQRQDLHCVSLKPDFVSSNNIHNSFYNNCGHSNPVSMVQQGSGRSASPLEEASREGTFVQQENHFMTQVWKL